MSGNSAVAIGEAEVSSSLIVKSFFGRILFGLDRGLVGWIYRTSLWTSQSVEWCHLKVCRLCEYAHVRDDTKSYGGSVWSNGSNCCEPP